MKGMKETRLKSSSPSPQEIGLYIWGGETWRERERTGKVGSERNGWREGGRARER